MLYISHGGGPMPLMADPSHQELISVLQNLSKTMRRPSAIVVISAHWESEVTSITSSTHPQMIYDYYGFPAETYAIKYPAPGEPGLARAMHDALHQAGIAATLDAERGFDHGLFVPLKLMYPEADIPCVQLSLENSLDPEKHIAIGRALQALQWDDLLILGSGFSFHNMRAFSSAEGDTRVKNQLFQDWLKNAVASEALTNEQRCNELIRWERAPHARFCHPREEHLLPLHVCCGLCGVARCDRVYELDILNIKALMFLWEGIGR